MGNNFYGPHFIHPKPDDLMRWPMLFQALDCPADLLTMDTFFYRVTAAVIMTHHKKPGGFIDINGNVDAAQYFPDVLLVAQNIVHPGFSDHIHEIHRIILFDPLQNRQLDTPIHAVKAGRSYIHSIPPIPVDIGGHFTQKSKKMQFISKASTFIAYFSCKRGFDHHSY